ncbi:MAG: hypothetical protein GQ529_02275 [Methyloprofundus sp.]|nr:hypothetical protein [Methyloprofundus sp.]
MKVINLYRLILLFVYTLLVACTQHKIEQESVSIAPSQAKTYVYECPAGYDFVVSIEDDQAWLFLAGKTIQLPRVPSASGEKYSDKQTTFWSKGDESRLELGTQKHIACKNNHAKAIWEHAKLKGVDFRALGNEPGWTLELVGDDTIIFSHFYDKINKYVFIRSAPEVDQVARKAVYKAKNEEHELSVTISGTPCQDSMSGESFESSVTVRLDGKLFNGCGKTLH